MNLSLRGTLRVPMPQCWGVKSSRIHMSALGSVMNSSLQIFLAPGTGFLEDIFSMGWWTGRFLDDSQEQVN